MTDTSETQGQPPVAGAKPAAKPDWAQGRRDRANAERVAKGLKPKRRIWPWIVLGVIVVGIVALFLMPPPPVVEEEAAPPPAMQIRQSETTTLAPTTLRETVKVTGTLVPGQQSDVASQASGRVDSVAVRPGDNVAEGTTLAEIDGETLELQLNQQRANAEATRAQLVSAQQTLQRTEELARQELASPSQLEQARSAAAALEAQLSALESGVRTAELALANATVKSPLAGVVASRSVEPGQIVAAGTPLFNIVNLDRLEFRANASITSAARVAADQPVAVTAAGLEGQDFAGVVTRVNPVTLSGTRTVPIYIELDNVDGALRGGMFATGIITVAEKLEALGVPASAVREDTDGVFVLKLVDGALVRQAVERVRDWDRGRLVEVSGLVAGDVVVSAQLDELEAGDAYVLVEG